MYFLIYCMYIRCCLKIICLVLITYLLIILLLCFMDIHMINNFYYPYNLISKIISRDPYFLACPRVFKIIEPALIWAWIECFFKKCEWEVGATVSARQCYAGSSGSWLCYSDRGRVYFLQNFLKSIFLKKSWKIYKNKKNTTDHATGWV
jgi:hypothetical protein